MRSFVEPKQSTRSGVAVFGLQAGVTVDNYVGRACAYSLVHEACERGEAAVAQQLHVAGLAVVQLDGDIGAGSDRLLFAVRDKEVDESPTVRNLIHPRRGHSLKSWRVLQRTACYKHLEQSMDMQTRASSNPVNRKGTSLDTSRKTLSAHSF
eukprot:6196653-Pleurochrysis_carterae.AAC.1